MTILSTGSLFYFSYLSNTDGDLFSLLMCGFLVFNLLTSIGNTNVVSMFINRVVESIRNMNFITISLLSLVGLVIGTYLPELNDDNMYFLPMLVCSVGVVLVLCVYLLGMLFSLYKTYTAIKEVIIVRGVPGIGKRNYVAWLENSFENVGDFRLYYWQDYFGRGNRYSFNPMQVKKAEMWSLMNFVRGIMSGVNRLYVLSTFEHMWQYDIYITIAKLAGYSYRIVELECLSERHLRHYSERSTHMIPYSKSLSVFHSWEVDPRAVLQEPYHESTWNGDSVPLYDDSVTNETLDEELEDYLSGIKVSSDSNIMNSCNKRTTHVIEYMSDFDRTFIGV
jgi:hypothetical protein